MLTPLVVTDQTPNKICIYSKNFLKRKVCDPSLPLFITIEEERKYKERKLLNFSDRTICIRRN